MLIEPCKSPDELICCITGMRCRLMHCFHFKATTGLSIVRVMVKMLMIVAEPAGSFAGLRLKMQVVADVKARSCMGNKFAAACSA